MSHQYKDPNADPSTIGPQLTTYAFVRKALIENRENQYFMPLGSVVNLPKHMGKTLKQYLYIPLLDDRNVNDQGIDANGVAIVDGNLYGSSRDIGVIPDKMPELSEVGGRVNRVGFTRKEIQGSIAEYGIFTEYTKDSLDFDTDAELYLHINREMLRGATEVSEDLLQIDLLEGAGTVRYGGTATQTSEVDASSGLTFGDLVLGSIDLDKNHTPMKTTVVTGSRNVDTRVIPGARIAFTGSELTPSFMRMKDYHNNPAFIPVEQYAAAGTILNGEIGTLGKFRIVVVPNMMRWSGAGEIAQPADQGTHYTTSKGGDVRFDVFPVLVVGDGSFQTIGFQTDGRKVKFEIMHKRPGMETMGHIDPFGKTGVMSIQWWYGFLPLRPERILLYKVSGELA